MDIPEPKPALVIRYAYLWADEHEAGSEEAQKDRPACIVMTLQGESDNVRAAVVPITHTPPNTDDDAIEIPTLIKNHLGLDDARSWVVVTEINVFNWPGPDLRPAAPNSDTAAFGYLPAGFFRTVRDRFVANIKAAKVQQVPRSE